MVLLAGWLTAGLLPKGGLARLLPKGGLARLLPKGGCSRVLTVSSRH